MINKAILLGRVGKKEYKETKNGSFLCNVSVATSRKYLDSYNQQRETTTWHNVNFFNKLADIANKFLQVGDLVYIEGEISNRKIDDNGVNRIVSSIVGNEIKFIPTGKRNLPDQSDEHPKSSMGNIENSYEVNRVSEIESDESIPF